MGDGVLIYFGYPDADEDDAERAARAGLVVIDVFGPFPTAQVRPTPVDRYVDSGESCA
jgi:class 3 adenylate cyclase